MCVCRHAHATECIWKLEDNLKESILPFHHLVCLVEVKSGLGGKHFYRLSYITSPPSLSANIFSAVTKKVGTTIPKDDPIVSATGKLLPGFEVDVPTTTTKKMVTSTKKANHVPTSHVPPFFSLLSGEMRTLSVPLHLPSCSDIKSEPHTMWAAVTNCHN